MSAFLVNEKTMQSACEGMLFAEDRNWYGECAEYTAEAVTMLGRQLYALNNDALDARYPTDPGERDDLETTFNGRRVTITQARECCVPDMVQRYKSLACLLYQCNEGENDQRELYQRAEQAARVLAERIVQSSKLWEQAAWGMN